ncbi:MAG: Fe-S cluster protein [Anaerolineae bacterium]|nr:MAG: Fe-S cluster protein [Anaerolineae bacterium]
MLIEHYDLEIFTPPCAPGAERFAAIARLTTDIATVLPYLNATLRGAVYNSAAGAVSWKTDGHHVVFHADKIAISDVEDRDAAIKEIEGLVSLVNRTWERRDEITPDHTTHQRPTPLAVYQLLPQTNCQQCGQPTCFTFALKLVASQVHLEDCPPLFEPLYADKLMALQTMVIDAPTIK